MANSEVTGVIGQALFTGVRFGTPSGCTAEPLGVLKDWRNRVFAFVGAGSHFQRRVASDANDGDGRRLCV